MLARVQTDADVAEEIEWTVSVDSTIARAHQHSAGARRLPGRCELKRGSNTRKTKVWVAAAEG